MSFYAVDFETHYTKEYSLKTLGIDAYVKHDLFDPYLVAVWGPDLQYVGHPRNFDWSKLNGQSLLAHNARFDETVFLRCQELGIIPKDCVPKAWYCTADLAVYLSAPRNLVGAASTLLGRKRDKAVRDRLGKITYADACAQGMKDEIDQYGLDDARDCFELWAGFNDQWPALEQRISQQNRDDSRRGVRVDIPRLRRYLGNVQTIRWEAGKLIPWDWDDLKTPLSPKALALECRKAGIPTPLSLAMDSAECMEWEDTYGAEYPWVGAMRDWRRSNIMLKRLQTIERRLQGDIFPYSIKYFGAHTGRFSGDGGFNMQNMPRGMNMGVDLRSLFIPRDGKKMLIADLAQIEARITLWLAGDLLTLVEIAKGLSVYEAHAIHTMGWDHANGLLKVADPGLYILAKARVLGLGFGCGPAKFKKVAKKMANLDLTPKESQTCVADFRATNPKIVSLWRKLQQDCTWSRKGDYVMELPSGRNLTYYDVKSGRDGLTAALMRGGGRREHLYGGRLTENAVQAIARDLFIEKMDLLHSAGLPQLFHSHDENVLEVDQDVKEEDVVEALSVTPDWLEGCPVAAEAFSVERYQK